MSVQHNRGNQHTLPCNTPAAGSSTHTCRLCIQVFVFCFFLIETGKKQSEKHPPGADATETQNQFSCSLRGAASSSSAQHAAHHFTNYQHACSDPILLRRRCQVSEPSRNEPCAPTKTQEVTTIIDRDRNTDREIEIL